MELEEVIYKRRTIRRFKEKPISIDILKKLIDFARLAPMARNIQGLEFIIVQKAEIREELFPLVRWASSLPEDQRTPEEGRQPTAYIIVLVNKKIKNSYYDFDVGAAVENILLGAVNFGLGCCWMGSIDRKGIRKLFIIPDYYEITHVISMGYPDEESVTEPYEDSFDYWKDDRGQIYVPKRGLNEILLKIF
ncbi:MAG: nitroreductase family protein [Candidatus Lokiarchaeota archaeon]|nr:nitroreductase family protein [Candidatus Lokiarchaeota archaeon]